MAGIVARIGGVTLAVAVSWALAPAIVGAGPAGRIETPYVSSAPLAEAVIGSVVSVPVPLPAGAGPRPAACDRLSYLRSRSADGTENSADSDRILVAQPAIFEGAGAFESVTRNTVVAAAERGTHIDPQVRRKKVLCGGHSLGGFITGYFAEWDFDGALNGAVSTASPVLTLPAVINPATTNLLALTGLAARLEPEGVDGIVRRMPRDANVDWTLRSLLAKDYGMFVTGMPDVRTLTATNEAVLDAVLDDNSQPFGFLQASIGFLTGASLEDKTFPLPSTPEISATAMFGGAPKVAPAVCGDPGAVYRWLDYDEVGTATSLPDEARHTNPAGEVTSISELARNLSDHRWILPNRTSRRSCRSTSHRIRASRAHPSGRGVTEPGPDVAGRRGTAPARDAPSGRTAGGPAGIQRHRRAHRRGRPERRAARTGLAGTCRVRDDLSRSARTPERLAAYVGGKPSPWLPECAPVLLR